MIKGDVCIFYGNRTYSGENSIYYKSRPVIIVSNNKNNKYSEIVEIVFASSIMDKNKLPTHVLINQGFKKQSIAICEQIMSVSKRDLGSVLFNIGKSNIKRIDDALKLSLGIDGVCDYITL